MIHFNFNGNKYTIVSWSALCGLMEIKKDNGKIGRFVKYDNKLKLTDFLRMLEKINFM